MIHTCITSGCGRDPGIHHSRCGRCRYRIASYGDPHFDPAADVEPVEVEIVVAARRPAAGLSRAEQRLIAGQLTELGVSALQIAQIVGVADRSVCRWRAEDRAAAVARAARQPRDA